MKCSRLLLAPLAALSGALSASVASAASETYLVDFGRPKQAPYVWKEGDFGLLAAPQVITEPETGDLTGQAFKNVRYKIGTATLTFPVVGVYTLVQKSAPSLFVCSFFFSTTARAEIGSPVTFTITTASPDDRITIAGIGGVQKGNKAVVIIEDDKAVIDSNDAFVPIVSRLTGKTTYTGSFASPAAKGEANLGGLLIRIDSN